MLASGLLLATRHAVAALIHRHPDQVRKLCRPVACDVRSRAALYDADAADETFRELARRVA